jgi:hypothetical protein
MECDGVGPDDAAAESARILDALGVLRSPDLVGMANA